MSRPLTVEAIDHIVINVRDVEVSAAWYQRVLGMTREQFAREVQAPRTALKFGAQKINLRAVSARQHDWFTAAVASPGTHGPVLPDPHNTARCHSAPAAIGDRDRTRPDGKDRRARHPAVGLLP